MNMTYHLEFVFIRRASAPRLPRIVHLQLGPLVHEVVALLRPANTYRILGPVEDE